MLTYCLKCKKDTVNVEVINMYAVCGSKKSRFMKEQEVKGLLSRLGLKTPLSKIPLLSEILF